MHDLEERAALDGAAFVGEPGTVAACVHDDTVVIEQGHGLGKVVEEGFGQALREGRGVTRRGVSVRHVALHRGVVHVVLWLGRLGAGARRCAPGSHSAACLPPVPARH